MSKLLDILNYDFDNRKLVDYSFINKLMENNLWDEEFAERVIMEYKKFMYLICTKTEAAPCYLVDQVWHQHILYTKDYADFCQKFYGGFIHHNPDRYKNASSGLYEQTLLNYQKTFDQYPPKDIWDYWGKHVTVNIDNHYVIPTGDSKILIKLLKKELWF